MIRMTAIRCVFLCGSITSSGRTRIQSQFINALARGIYIMASKIRLSTVLRTVILTVASAFIHTLALVAQPSDAQVIKDVSGRMTIGVTLSGKGGTRQFNTDLGAYEWVRGALCTLKT